MLTLRSSSGRQGSFAVGCVSELACGCNLGAPSQDVSGALSIVPRCAAGFCGVFRAGSWCQLLCGQEEDEFIVEGLLNISWGLRRPIRLQMQDDNERIRPPPSSSSWHSGCNLGAQG